MRVCVRVVYTHDSACFTQWHHAALTCMQKDSTLSKLAAMEGAVPKQLQPTFKKVIQRLQQVAVT